jgi:Fe-S cluster assembly scaffold protein SufB
MSRGFKKNEAEKILEKAFFEQVLNSVKIKEAHAWIKDYLC